MVDRATQSLVTTALIIFAVLSGLLLVTWQGLKLYRSRLQADIEAQPKTKPRKTMQSRTPRYPFMRRSATAMRGAGNGEPPPADVSVFENDSDDGGTSKPLPSLPSRLQRVYPRGRPGQQGRRGHKQVQIETTPPRSTYGQGSRFDGINYSQLERFGTMEVVADPQDLQPSLTSPNSAAKQNVTPIMRHMSQQASTHDIHTAPSSPRLEGRAGSGTDQNFF